MGFFIGGNMNEICFEIFLNENVTGFLIGVPIGLFLGWLVMRGIWAIIDNIPGRDRTKNHG